MPLKKNASDDAVVFVARFTPLFIASSGQNISIFFIKIHQFSTRSLATPKKKKKKKMGKSTLLATTLGALAIGARAGAVDLTEGDFDAQVFESGKVRACRIGLLLRAGFFFQFDRDLCIKRARLCDSMIALFTSQARDNNKRLTVQISLTHFRARS